MSPKSNKEDIELPLLSKNSRQEEQEENFNKTDNSRPKYFETSLISRALFAWVDHFLSKPESSTFQQEDHYNLREEEECGNIAEKFHAEWDHVKGWKYPMLWAQYNSFKSSVWTSQLLAMIDTCCGFTGPLLIANIIRYIQNPEPELTEGFLLIVLFVSSRIGVILANSQNTQYLTVLQNKMLKGTLSLIYKKSLQFPLMRSHEISAGNIMTYLLVDAENLCKIFFLAPQLVQFPILLIIGISILYRAVGMAFIAGGITVLITGSVISWLTKITFTYQKKVMSSKDVRMKKTNEILTGIKYIKMCGTEKNFLESVNKDRDQEVDWIKKKNYLSALRIITFWLGPVLLSISVFGCYILFNGNLTPEKTFVVLSTISILQGPINNIGQLLNDLLQGLVSLKRVEQFMFNGEVDTSYIARSKQAASNIALKITNGNFYWLNKPLEAEEKELFSQESTTSGYKLILKDINMTIPKGSFVAILGDVGSGKSSLFNSVLGEMVYDPKNPPLIELNGSIAYMAQKPWITNATIKENIVFDNVYDETRYKEALRTSCLKADLKTLIKQDQTEIGEKGVNLSGGQKARVALARAIYSDSDIYFMDDPLSAVDAHVAKYILEECLSKKLKEKTRVLVTHKLESLKYVDYIYIFKSGEVIAEGTFEAIKKTRIYQEIEEKSNKEAEVEKNEDEEDFKQEEEERQYDAKKSLKKISEKIMKESEKIMKESEKDNSKKTQRKETSFHEGQEQKEMMEKLMLTEDRQTGAVTWAIWKSFLNYFGSVQFFIVLMTAIVLWLGLKTLSDFWLAHWSNNSATDMEHGNGYYYGIYMILTLSSVALLFVRMIMAVNGGVGVSKRLHYDMFKQVIRAPINLFFDRVPLGRLINRFASDLDIVDNTMPFTLSRIAFMPVDIIAKVLVCCIAGTVWVLPLACLFVYMGFKIQQRYFRVYREAFRLSRITSSPITSMVAESLDGLTQIRSLEYQDKFLKKFAVRQNEHMKNLILLAGLWGWFSFRVNIASLMIVGPTIAAAILLSHQLNGSAGLMGLLVTYLLDMSGIMTFLLYQYSLFESNLISFERCRAFTKVEVENESKTKLPLANYSRSWPAFGEIEFKNYYAKYRPNLPYVLKNVSFKIFGSEKIGVVGRTGSGKSTTLLALLRIIEGHAGQIFIDNVDISQIGLDDLRRKITIIPQDPLLYKGTLRENLDLLGMYSEPELWKALEKVCMKNKFVDSGLQTEIKEGGENLSAGEKQLICIARAILNKNKIILVDEATSSIDNVTEEAILESIRENFKDCTVITIAHRLKTIISSDRILFMQDGRVAEFDTPKNLLNYKNGLFYGLWKEYEAAKA